MNRSGWIFLTLALFAGCTRMSNLTGQWVGEYSYVDSRASLPAVTFKASLLQKGNRFSGFIQEPNTFDPPNPKKTQNRPAELTATIFDGTIKNEQIRFRKQYNDEGGYKHSVDYEGTIDRESRTISGQWTIGPSTGAFRMSWGDR